MSSNKSMMISTRRLLEENKTDEWITCSNWGEINHIHNEGNYCTDGDVGTENGQNELYDCDGDLKERKKHNINIYINDQKETYKYIKKRVTHNNEIGNNLGKVFESDDNTIENEIEFNNRFQI